MIEISPRERALLQQSAGQGLRISVYAKSLMRALLLVEALEVTKDHCGTCQVTKVF